MGHWIRQHPTVYISTLYNYVQLVIKFLIQHNSSKGMGYKIATSSVCQIEDQYTFSYLVVSLSQVPALFLLVYTYYLYSLV